MKSLPNDQAQSTKVEGEGSITADRRYRAGVQKTVNGGHVDELAHSAQEALEGAEGEQLRAAEKLGKAGNKGKPGRLSKLSAEELSRAEGEGMVAPVPEKP